MFDLELNGEIGYWGINLQDVNYELKKLSGNIKILFNSNGGSTVEGIAIFNAFREYRKNKGDIEITIQSMGASMGSYIPLSANKVIVYDNTTFMIHNARIFTGGDQNHLRHVANTVEGFSNILKSEYIRKTGKSDDDIQTAMNDETFYFGKEILDMGFADEVISSGEEIDKESALLVAKASFDETMKNTEARMKDEKIETYAAILKDYEIKAVGTNPSKKEQIEIKSKGENMPISKDDFIALKQSDPEAFKALIGGAVGDAVSAETKRVSGIMALGGNQEFTQKAIEDGSTVGDSAIALLKVNQETQEKAKTDFELAADEVDGVVQAKSEDLTPEALAQQEADDALSKWGEK